MAEIIIFSIFMTLPLLLGIVLLRSLYYNLMAISDIKEENIKEAMVVRNGRDLAMDVAGAGLRELKVADVGKCQAREVVKRARCGTCANPRCSTRRLTMEN